MSSFLYGTVLDDAITTKGLGEMSHRNLQFSFVANEAYTIVARSGIVIRIVIEDARTQKVHRD